MMLNKCVKIECICDERWKKTFSQEYWKKHNCCPIILFAFKFLNRSWMLSRKHLKINIFY